MAQFDMNAFYICGEYGNMLNHKGNVYSNLIPIEKIVYMEKRKKGPEFCTTCRALGHWNGCFVLYCINCEKREENQSCGLENGCGALTVGIENNSDSEYSATNTYLKSILSIQVNHRQEDGMPLIFGEIDWNQIGDKTLEDTFSIQQKRRPIQEILRETCGTYFISRVLLPFQGVCLDTLSKEAVDLYQIQVDNFVDQYYEKPNKEEAAKIQNELEKSVVPPCKWDFNQFTGAYEPEFLIEYSSREETFFKKQIKQVQAFYNAFGFGVYEPGETFFHLQYSTLFENFKKEQDNTQEMLSILEEEEPKKHSRMCSRKRMQRDEDYDYSSDNSSIDEETIKVFLNEEKWFEMKVEEEDQQAYELATQTGIFDFSNTYQQEYEPTYIGVKPHND